MIAVILIVTFSFSNRTEEWRAVVGTYGIPKDYHMQPIKFLSDGLKTRLVFCEISLLNPHLLLLDEPTVRLHVSYIVYFLFKSDSYSYNRTLLIWKWLIVWQRLSKPLMAEWCELTYLIDNSTPNFFIFSNSYRLLFPMTSGYYNKSRKKFGSDFFII